MAMFEELFSRRKQARTKRVEREIDAITKKSGKGSRRNPHSSMTVSAYLWGARSIVAVIILVGLVIIGIQGYGLVEDFLIHSSGSSAQELIDDSSGAQGEDSAN